MSQPIFLLDEQTSMLLWVVESFFYSRVPSMWCHTRYQLFLTTYKTIRYVIHSHLTVNQNDGSHEQGLFYCNEPIP